MDTLLPFQFRLPPPSQPPKPIITPPILSHPSKTPSRRLPLPPHTNRPTLTLTLNPANDHETYGIPANHVKTLAKFNSLHNHIRVLQVSRRSDHPLAGSRLLLLDRPGNIHSISFLLHPFTSTYFDVFATLPPLLPPGPIAILGFGAGSAARLLLHIYPDLEIHGWELDPSVIAVAREFFGLEKLERQRCRNLFVCVGDALDETVAGGSGRFAGIYVDLFQRGSVLKELQDPDIWRSLRRRLKKGGRVMVNCGGKCVEAEDQRRDGETVMGETVMAMRSAFDDDKVFVLMMDYGGSEGCVAMTGPWPEDTEKWKMALPKPLRGYVDRWKPFTR